MSDTANAAPTAAPATDTPLSAAPAQPAPVGLTSDQLRARLDETRAAERARLLRDLGVPDVDAAKAALAAAKQAEDANKTEAEKLRARLGELEPAAKRRDELEAVVRARAESEMQTLTDAQRAAVVALGGEDPAAQLRAITALRPTWAAAAPPPAAPAPPPQTTAPAPAAPQPAAPGKPDHLATWQSLQKTNPVAAARYLLAHRAAIAEARKAGGANA